MQLLWLVGKGKSLKEVAETVGASYCIGQNWIGWYRSGGVEKGLSRCHGGSGGRLARLSSNQEQTLLEDVRGRGPYDPGRRGTDAL